MEKQKTIKLKNRVHLGRVSIGTQELLRWLQLDDGVIRDAKYSYGRIELIVEHPELPSLDISQPIPEFELVYVTNSKESVKRKPLTETMVKGEETCHIMQTALSPRLET